MRIAPNVESQTSLLGKSSELFPETPNVLTMVGMLPGTIQSLILVPSELVYQPVNLMSNMMVYWPFAKYDPLK